MRKKGDLKDLKGHHDVSGFVFTNIGVLYSVLLAFTVVNVQQRFDKIGETIRIEAAYLSELYRDAAVFEKQDEKTIQLAIIAYCKSIIQVEWAVLSKGKPHPTTTKFLNDVWHSYYNIELNSSKQEIFYAESIRKLNDSISARISRLLGGEESLGNEMWTMLILGGMLIVAFLSMFTFDKIGGLHLLLACLLAAAIAFPLFLIYSLDTAFSGSLSFEPEALTEVLESFKQPI
ncbi:MAG: DUF4239 domain-containing protein [Parachlamydiaceae bacterium]|nr:DUF4239 domain-containing protein [Parachlamydiaceae bacterium]